MENNEKLLKLIASIYTESENELETIRKDRDVELERIQKEKEEVQLKLKNAEHRTNLILVFSFVLLLVSLLVCAFFGKYSIDKAYELIGGIEIEVVQDSSENYNSNNDVISENSNVLIGSDSNSINK